MGINTRHQPGPIDQWCDVIGDPTLADAILDRFAHNAHRFLEPRRMAEKALTAVIQEVYIRGSRPDRWMTWSKPWG